MDLRLKSSASPGFLCGCMMGRYGGGGESAEVRGKRSKVVRVMQRKVH